MITLNVLEEFYFYAIASDRCLVSAATQVWDCEGNNGVGISLLTVKCLKLRRHFNFRNH